jgi:hypothetical protein
LSSLQNINSWEKTLSSNFQIRPRFKLIVKESPTEILDKIKNGISVEGSGVTGWTADRSAHVQTIEKERHIWSPQLTIYAEQIEDSTELRCVIGPNSTLWTTILFFYAVIGMGALLGLLWGLSQLTLGQAPQAFWLIAIAVVLTGLVFFMAKVGQKLSSDQMIILRDFVIEIAGKDVKIIE